MPQILCCVHYWEWGLALSLLDLVWLQWFVWPIGDGRSDILGLLRLGHKKPCSFCRCLGTLILRSQFPYLRQHKQPHGETHVDRIQVSWLSSQPTASRLVSHIGELFLWVYPTAPWMQGAGWPIVLSSAQVTDLWANWMTCGCFKYKVWEKFVTQQ